MSVLFGKSEGTSGYVAVSRGANQEVQMPALLSSPSHRTMSYLSGCLPRAGSRPSWVSRSTPTGDVASSPARAQRARSPLRRRPRPALAPGSGGQRPLGSPPCGCTSPCLRPNSLPRKLTHSAPPASPRLASSCTLDSPGDVLSNMPDPGPSGEDSQCHQERCGPATLVPGPQCCVRSGCPRLGPLQPPCCGISRSPPSATAPRLMSPCNALPFFPALRPSKLQQRPLYGPPELRWFLLLSVLRWDAVAAGDPSASCDPAPPCSTPAWNARAQDGSPRPLPLSPGSPVTSLGSAGFGLRRQPLDLQATLRMLFLSGWAPPSPLRLSSPRDSDVTCTTVLPHVPSPRGQPLLLAGLAA